MSTAPQVKGWCPSAWRPMLSGDGYLARLHFSCGIVSSGQVRVIAALAGRHGNGFIDLTRRGNLQIRGIAEERVPQLQSELLAQNLIPPEADGGGTPKVIASPLAGRDRVALVDIRPLVRELEERFTADPHAWDLPAKFCVAVDDGGRFPLRDLAADIGFAAWQHGGIVRFSVGLGGEPVGFVEANDVAETALALAAAFTELRKGSVPHSRRMRDLVDGIGADAILASCSRLSRASRKAQAPPRLVHGGSDPAQDAVGRIAQNVFGVAAPFGSLTVAQLALLSDVAEDHAGGELRLTPWRAILIPMIASGALDCVEAKCARAGLITQSFDPRRHVEACVGAPACASASVSARDVAGTLAPLMTRETLHISGCAKSCASSAKASITLVGRAGGFDLVRNGKASDTPGLFGLSAEEARIAVERMAARDLVHV